MKPKHVEIVVAAVAVAVGLAAPSGASRGAGGAGGVVVGPATIRADLDGRGIAERVEVVNRDDAPRRVSLTVAGIGHDLDGNPNFIEPSSVAGALTPSRDHFVLGPRERRAITLSGTVPPGRASLYAGLVVRSERLGRTRSSRPTSRAANILVRGPRPWTERVRVAGVGAGAASSRRDLTVYATVENTGDVHVDARGRLLLFRGSRRIGSVRLGRATILPGYARRLTGTWRPPPDLGGDVAVQALIERPEAAGIGTISFRSGRAVVEAMSIADLTARSGASPTVSFTLANTGNSVLAPRVRLIARKPGSPAIVETITEASLEPGERTKAILRPDLGSGRYTVLVRATAGGRLLDQGAVGLEVEATAPVAVAVLLLAAAAVLAVIVLGRTGSPGGLRANAGGPGRRGSGGGLGRSAPARRRMRPRRWRRSRVKKGAVPAED